MYVEGMCHSIKQVMPAPEEYTMTYLYNYVIRAKRYNFKPKRAVMCTFKDSYRPYDQTRVGEVDARIADI